MKDQKSKKGYYLKEVNDLMKLANEYGLKGKKFISLEHTPVDKEYEKTHSNIYYEGK